MMIANLRFFTRILMTFHIKSTSQRLCNGLNLRHKILFVGTDLLDLQVENCGVSV